MTDATDMSTPVTRGELRAEFEHFERRLEHRLADLVTKADLESTLESKLESKLENKLAHLATKADLESTLESKLENKLAHLATKADLGIWGGALLERMTSEIAREIARHTKAFQEEMSKQFSVVDDKYSDLPGRVHRLETTVFTPKRR